MTSAVLDLSAKLAASLATVDPPKPGVYEGVSFAEYHAWPAAANSRLGALRKSPAHLREYILNPGDTETLIQGRALHCAVLEPDDFPARFGRFDGDARTKEGKAKKDELAKKFGRSFVLRADDYDNVLRARQSVFAHPAHRLLTGKHELSIVWLDEETGTLCKARHDCHSPALGGGAIVDLKKARDASKRAFMRSIHSYGYAIQAAHYTAGAQAHGLNFQHYVNFAVETESPWNCQAYRMMEAAIDAGEQERRFLLRKYAELLALPMSEWPVGYSDMAVDDITLPDWTWAQIDEDTKES